MNDFFTTLSVFNMDKLNAIIIEKLNSKEGSISHFITGKSSHNIVIVDTISNLNDIPNLLKKEPIDVIFLDTDVVSDNVFKFLEPYHEDIADKELIVISSGPEFAIDAFKLSAIDYVLKPFIPSEIEKAINKAKINIQKDRAELHNHYAIPKVPIKIVAIPSLTEVKILPVDSIIYLKSEGKYTTFYTIDGKSTVSSRNLGVYEKLLSNNNFFRIHHSYIVNVDLASNVYKKDGTYLEIYNKKYLPISKRKAESFYRFIGV
jgi:two-component system LytT family response regulator